MRFVTPFRGEAGDAPVPICGASIGDASYLGAATKLPVGAGGAGWTMEEARMAALGEACERYCATMVDRARIHYAAPKDVPGAVRGWAGFTAQQLAHPDMHGAPWDEDALMGWVRAERIPGGEAWVPAQFVWVPYGPVPGERIVAPGLTTGFGAGPTAEHARLAGLYEVVERDAFTLAWLTRAVPPELPMTEWTPRMRSLARHARLRLFDLTHDVGLPTYMCVLEKAGAVGQAIAVGAATRHDAHHAAEKATLEAFQTFPYVREMVRADPGWRARPDFSNLTDFRQHCRFYTVHPEHRAGIAHLLDGPAPRAVSLADRTLGDVDPAVASRLDDAAARLARCDLEAYAVDITTIDVREGGLHVQRVLVPGAQPLHGIHHAAHLEGPRLLAAHRHLPYLDGPREVTPWPHPFA